MEEGTTYDKKSLKKVIGKTSDFPELSRDCVAFANAKGGFLHIGIEDGEELPPANQKIEDGLAEKIVEEDVPEGLKGKRVVSVDLSNMVAGAKYRGDFEERIKKMLKEVQKSRDVILFIDEIHTIVGNLSD